MDSLKEGKERLADVFRYVGREIAKVHRLGVSLGDCKPENIIITPDGKVYFVDLEQAEKEGDKAWDIAELLYYSGHYVSLSSRETARMMTRKFIEGYLEERGEIENLKKARSPKYLKVFSFFTPPHMIFTISSTCRETLKRRATKE
jgi:tRNA A-37 threonylcarbamoyl transferase component Bud32